MFCSGTKPFVGTLLAQQNPVGYTHLRTRNIYRLLPARSKCMVRVILPGTLRWTIPWLAREVVQTRTWTFRVTGLFFLNRNIITDPLCLPEPRFDCEWDLALCEIKRVVTSYTARQFLTYSILIYTHLTTGWCMARSNWLKSPFLCQNMSVTNRRISIILHQSSICDEPSCRPLECPTIALTTADCQL